MSLIQDAFSTYKVTCRNKPKSIAKYILRGVIHRKSLKLLNDNFKCGERKVVFRNQPEFALKAMRPYLRAGLSRMMAVKAVVNHHEWLDSHINLTARQMIYQHGLTLHSFDIGEETFMIKFLFLDSYRREGELTLALCDNTGNKRYVITFTVHEGSAYIGGVQGSVDNDNFSRRFTKTVYGIRPKAFVVEALRIVLNYFNINNLYAVKNSAHVYTDTRYKKKLNFNYDQLWREQRGVEFNDWYYHLPLISERKDIELIKRPKRKMYRERYTWLDKLDHDLAEELAKISIC
ncbi:DUF535 domain-containing protein [Photobacterium gaetbulicola]|uniref:Putative virK protein n=1 Tax=Photobacterium gaetbulicola Gung47 TaxID=658445 RepID=A0A0C5W303_9GAMM|nr:DUF535 family protein [Photobacterium gaetbulicola]AJR05731.1 putative virK protein [Photobacterium gaetbulicola Gung47]PSU14698.1 DUF535 domain-containing protein [Photobacterium gaetbulicola]